MNLIRIGRAAYAGLLCLMMHPAAAQVQVIREEFRLPTQTAGIELYVRNKRPADLVNFTPGRTLLYVHGATYPSETAFDLELDQLSWMDYIARQGWDVWLVDVRGYGRSDRPPEMAQAAQDHAPIVDTEVAVGDVSTAVDFVLAKRGLNKLCLLGWSWGTSIMGAYTARNNARVAKLVLYAPLWLFDKPAPPSPALGAYRSVTMEQARQRWLRGVPDAAQASLIPAGWFETWWNATLATDPVGAAQTPPVLRAPNGVVQDLRRYWMAGRAFYDPAEIRVPTMLVHAEWDADLPLYQVQGYFQRLVNAPSRRWVEIGEGTHTVIMEKNRMQLFREVQLFLDEPLGARPCSAGSNGLHRDHWHAHCAHRKQCCWPQPPC